MIVHRAPGRRVQLAAACCAALAALTLTAAGATAARAGVAVKDSAPAATTNSGAVRGTTAGTVDEFLGIPYAAPPVEQPALAPPGRCGQLAWCPGCDAVRSELPAGHREESVPAARADQRGLPVSERLHTGVTPERSPARARVDPRRRSRPGRRPQLRRRQAGGGRRGRGHDQLPSRRARLPGPPGTGLPSGRLGRQLRPDGPAGGPALGPAQHRAVRRRPAQRDHRGPVGRRPVGAGPDGLARRPRAVPAGDRAERHVRPEPAAAGHGRGGRRDVRHGGRLPGPERGVPAQRAGQRPGRQFRRRDSRRRRRLGAHPADRNGPGPRAVRPGAGHQRHHPRRGTALRRRPRHHREPGDEHTAGRRPGAAPRTTRPTSPRPWACRPRGPRRSRPSTRSAPTRRRMWPSACSSRTRASRARPCRSTAGPPRAASRPTPTSSTTTTRR